MKKIHRSPFFPNACSYSYCILIRRICLLNLSRETRKKKSRVWRQMASIVCAQQREKERKAANCFLNCCGFLSLGHSRTHEKADSFLYGCLSLETLNWRRWAPSRALFDFHLPDSLSNQPSHANDLKRMYVSFPFGNWRPLFFFSLFLCVVFFFFFKTKWTWCRWNRSLSMSVLFPLLWRSTFYDHLKKKEKRVNHFLLCNENANVLFLFLLCSWQVCISRLRYPPLPRASNCSSDGATWWHPS